MLGPGRKDGELVRDVPAYRRIMPFLMRGRNESSVYFEQTIDAGPALAFIEAFNREHADRITFFHLLLRGIVRALAERPRLNRFVSGGRLYQRNGIWISYSAKKRLDDDAPLVVMKRRFEASEPFDAMVARMATELREGRSDRKSAVDKELGLILSLPVPIVSRLVGLVRTLDATNLLPHAFIAGDPMFASVFVANLGSLKMDAAFHHNYEYGNIPIFVVIGRVHDAPFVRPDGTLGVRKQVVLRWTYDERIDDGLYCARSLEILKQRLESPAELM